MSVATGRPPTRRDERNVAPVVVHTPSRVPPHRGLAPVVRRHGPAVRPVVRRDPPSPAAPGTTRSASSIQHRALCAVVATLAVRSAAPSVVGEHIGSAVGHRREADGAQGIGESDLHRVSFRWQQAVGASLGRQPTARPSEFKVRTTNLNHNQRSERSDDRRSGVTPPPWHLIVGLGAGLGQQRRRLHVHVGHSVMSSSIWT